jgi:predicted nuclease of predicted toxin-antitoxin system
MRVLLDQGLPRSASTYLQQAGWDAVHVDTLGLSRASDRQILDRACLDGRIVVTLDADFHALLALADQHAPSVIRIRQERLGGREIADLLLRIWSRIEQPVWAGAMVTVTENAIRIRRLPLSAHTKRQGDT